MAIDASDLTDYTWAEIKTAAKQAMLTGAIAGTTLVIDGRTIGRITPEQAAKLYEFAARQQAAETTSGNGGIALAVTAERI